MFNAKAFRKPKKTIKPDFAKTLRNQTRTFSSLKNCFLKDSNEFSCETSVLPGKIKLFHSKTAKTKGKLMFYQPIFEQIIKTIEKTNFFNAKAARKPKKLIKPIFQRL